MNTSSQPAVSQAANALDDKSVIKEVHNTEMPSLQELKQGQPQPSNILCSYYLCKLPKVYSYGLQSL